METVYEFLYNPDSYESCAATVSIHKTQKGAEIAMEFHKNEVKREYDEDYAVNTSEDKEYYHNRFPFDYAQYWGIRETELKD